ncbi:MAG: haloacid dehalogenase, partial [Phototrophicales bacterium]
MSNRVEIIVLPYQGLSAAQVQQNRSRYGDNGLKPPKRQPWWRQFLAKFADPVVRILIVAAAIAIAVGVVENNYAEGIGIIVAIILATSLAFINEYQASQEFD